MLERRFDFNKMYGKIVRYYLEKKHYTKEKANLIAQQVVQRELKQRTCRNSGCGHLLHDHLRNNEVCLVSKCECAKFIRA
ncbi:MAG: hypothetical protein ACKOCQ_04825 [Candidatus Nitrosotenuis sp.]